MAGQEATQGGRGVVSKSVYAAVAIGCLALVGMLLGAAGVGSPSGLHLRESNALDKVSKQSVASRHLSEEVSGRREHAREDQPFKPVGGWGMGASDKDDWNNLFGAEGQRLEAMNRPDQDNSFSFSFGFARPDQDNSFSLSYGFDGMPAGNQPDQDMSFRFDFQSVRGQPNGDTNFVVGFGFDGMPGANQPDQDNNFSLSYGFGSDGGMRANQAGEDTSFSFGFGFARPDQDNSFSFSYGFDGVPGANQPDQDMGLNGFGF